MTSYQLALRGLEFICQWKHLQSKLFEVLHKQNHNYLAVAHLCWSCSSGSMCCRWRPPCLRATPVVLNPLLDLRSPTLTSLQCEPLLVHHRILAFLLCVHKKCVFAGRQFAQRNSVTCFELTRLLDQGRRGPPKKKKQIQNKQRNFSIQRE